MLTGAQIGWNALMAWAVLAGVMGVAWIAAVRTGNHGWIDVFWSYGIGIVGVGASFVPVMYAMASPSTTVDAWPRAALAAAMVAVWAIRLGTHIARRSLRGKDDPRYAQLRKEWGARYRMHLFGFLQIQALAGVPLVVAVMLTAGRAVPFADWRDGVGVVVFLIAWRGEAIADFQLRQFSRGAHAAGSVCDVGLWRWSRHPNYFFECLLWCVWPLIACAPLTAPWSVLTLLAPLLMYVLLAHVSGIPPLEAHMARSRGAVWNAYAARTSAFWPRRPAS
ncbi:DUF1295 domain-containing protein [Robbsia andropogonis]|nr:DUF1295 domain-containing protein [Robbsia andropogonis]MCP1118797.1 DUF1295 domain-containing protein [Robbsia andropogonis]MCP1128264.1 DUF1295 domain-containing protein [Robbsia andropogonis]